MYDETFATLYDLIHAGLTEDVAYVRRFARAAGAPVLELGCGSGRLLLPLARDGLAVTGVDSAPAMLARARRAAEQAGLSAQIELLEANFVTLDLSGRLFNAVVVGTNTIMHLNATQLRPALRAARRHVQQNALLLIDTANPLLLADADATADWALERLLNDPAGIGPISQYSRWEHDGEAQIISVDWRFEQAGQPPFLTRTAYHYHYPHELIEALQATAWQPQQLSGDYKDTPFEEESERLIVVARAV